MNKSIVLRIPPRKAASLAVMLALAILPQPLYAMPPSGGDTVQCLYDALLGAMKSGRTLGQSRRFAQSFGRYISAIYADRFDSYSGERLQVTGEQPAAAGVMVRSQIVKANGELVKVDYLMRRNGDAWLISDIYLDGAISEVATRRSEFAAILKSEGIDGLIAALNRKSNVLIATTAGSF